MSPSTASRWLEQVLTMVGFNTEVFKVHSTQSASSSKASTFQILVSNSDSSFQSGTLKQLWNEEVRLMNDL